MPITSENSISDIRDRTKVNGESCPFPYSESYSIVTISSR